MKKQGAVGGAWVQFCSYGSQPEWCYLLMVNLKIPHLMKYFVVPVSFPDDAPRSAQ